MSYKRYTVYAPNEEDPRDPVVIGWTNNFGTVREWVGSEEGAWYFDDETGREYFPKAAARRLSL